MRIPIKHIILYIITISIAIGLKVFYFSASFSDVYFLIKPLNTAIEFLTKNQSEFIEEVGFVYESQEIIINKSCSGFNLWVICFLMYSYMFISSSYKKQYHLYIIPSALLLSFLSTLFINTIRVYVSFLLKTSPLPLFRENTLVIHEMVGVINNFAFLIIIYYSLNYLLIKITSYETSLKS